MQNRAILSIDLGSAYTKISIRRDWNDRATLVRRLSVAQSGEEDFCVPSAVAHVARASRWLIGTDAANLVPGPGVELFLNWKASLFATSTPASALLLPSDAA